MEFSSIHFFCRLIIHAKNLVFFIGRQSFSDFFIYNQVSVFILFAFLFTDTVGLACCFFHDTAECLFHGFVIVYRTFFKTFQQSCFEIVFGVCVIHNSFPLHDIIPLPERFIHKIFNKNNYDQHIPFSICQP